MSNLVKKIQNFAFQQELWKAGDKIIVGVSGGPDSSCLLAVLAKLAPKLDLKLHIAHVNYGLRGADSEKDELFVRQLAKKYNIPLTVHVVKSKTHSGNLENELRKIRYDFFENLRKELGFSLIAIAHSNNDQVETVLMRILRGSGLQGLKAMRPKTGSVIRPLLESDRCEILAYLKQNTLKYRTDKSNKDISLMRNKIRLKLIPYLEKNYNPSLKQTVGQFAEHIANDYDYLSQQIKKNSNLIKHNDTFTEFSAKDLLTKHPALMNGILREAIGHLKSDLLEIESSHLKEIVKMLKSNKSKPQNVLIKGLVISKKGDKVTMTLKY
jgi:tRNA(Ile)-lysidine synthase